MQEPLHSHTRPAPQLFLIYKHNGAGILKPQLSGKGRFPGNNRPELSNNKKSYLVWQPLLARTPCQRPPQKALNGA